MRKKATETKNMIAKMIRMMKTVMILRGAMLDIHLTLKWEQQRGTIGSEKARDLINRELSRLRAPRISSLMRVT
jgi:DUF917 family protein